MTKDESAVCSMCNMGSDLLLLHPIAKAAKTGRYKNRRTNSFSLQEFVLAENRFYILLSD